MARPPRKTDRRAASLLHVNTETDRLIRRSGGKRGFISAQLLTLWPQIVGPSLARNTMPLRIIFKRLPGGSWQRDNGDLELKVASSAWAPEVQHLSPLIIEKINTFFGYGAVARIRIKIGPLPRPYVPPPPASPPPEAVARVESVVSGITDDKLREALLRLGAAIATPKPPPPPPPPRRVEAEPYRPGNRVRGMIPAALQPPEIDVLLLTRDGGRYHAVPCYGWWDVAARLMDDSRAKPEFWYYTEESLSDEDRRNLPLEALESLRKHGAVVEICRRAGQYEYFPPLPGKVPPFDLVVRHWIENQGLEVWLWTGAAALRAYLAKVPAGHPKARVLREAAAELGWLDPVDDEAEEEEGVAADSAEEEETDD